MLAEGARACLRNLFLFEQAEPAARPPSAARAGGRDGAAALQEARRARAGALCASDVGTAAAPAAWHAAATRLQFGYLLSLIHI